MTTDSRGIVLYRGPSVLTGAPIVAIATGLQAARRHSRQGVNAKTGAVVQVYILAGGRNPVAAHASGRDAAVCGDCPHRAGSCYVRLDRGPLQVWRAYQRGRYRQPSLQTARAALAGLPVRLGAYGDPAAVPLPVWETALGQAGSHTGYTHQWRTCDPGLRRWCMASCDSQAEAGQAQAAGWRTFTVVPKGATVPGQLALLCPASEEGGRKLHCVDCRACDGTAGGRHSQVWIPVHGAAHRQAAYNRLVQIDRRQVGHVALV